MIGRDVNVPISFFNRTVNNYPVLDKTLGPRVGIRRIALCGAVVVLVLGFVFCVWWKNASQQNEVTPCNDLEFLSRCQTTSSLVRHTKTIFILFSLTCLKLSLSKRYSNERSKRENLFVVNIITILM